MMKQRKIHVVYLLLIAVFVLSSCAKSSKNARFIPEDAVVVSLDLKQMFEKSKLGDSEDAKNKLMESFMSECKDQETKELCKKIVENPAKAGIDLREPILAYTTIGSQIGVVGTVLDKDDFTKLLSAMAKEGNAEEPQEKDGISYLQQGNKIMAYDDATFFYSESYTLDEIVEKFNNDDTQGTMAENDDFAKLIDSKGLVSILVPMVAVEKSISAQNKKSLPEGADLKDLSLLINFTSDKGRAIMSMETIAKSDAWKKAIKKFTSIYDKIDGDYLKYIPNDQFLLYTNIDGEDLYELLEQEGVFKQVGAESQKDLAKKVLESIDGDCAITIGELKGFMPEATIYIKTEDGTLSDLAKQNGLKPKKGVDFGYKDGTTYVVLGKDAAFTKAEDAVDKAAVKGHRFYCYCDFKTFSSLAGSYNRTTARQIRTAGEYISAVEFFDTGDTSCDLVLKMKDTEKDPIEFIAELFLQQIN